MLNVIDHIKRIFQGHKEIVHLIESVSIFNNLTKEEWEYGSVPIEESASCGLANILLPIANQFKFSIPVVDLLHLTTCVDSNIDEI